MIKIRLSGFALILGFAAKAQVAITTLSVPYTQNFNTLSDTTLTNPYSTLPAGWKAEEYGSGANTQYRAAHGELSGGDLYSFGDSLSTERALGSIGSGTVAPVYFGVALVNNTGGTVQKVKIGYRGELWRVGNPARTTGPDSLFFAWGKNNGNLHSNIWTTAAKLNYISPASPTGASNIDLNGNAPAQVTNYLDTLTNLNLANGDTLWLRWRDENSNSFDDGMAIDDVSITFLPGTPAAGLPTFTAFNTYYYQNFDNLGYAYTGSLNFSTLPLGWFAKETGSNGDNTYKASYGEFAGGNLYSFGDSLSTERALGSIGSGTNDKTHFGVAFINTIGQTVNDVEINYTGEMWRQGRPGRATGPDTLHFSYAVKAVGIDSGNYQSFPSLSFYSPITNGTLNTPMNGNLAANKTKISGIISNLNLKQGDTLWLRWTDFDSDSYDDGLALDSISIAPVLPSSLLNMEFRKPDTAVLEADGIISIPIVIHHKSAFLSQVNVFIADTGTIDLNTDITIASSVVSFPATKPDTIAYFKFGVNKTQPFEGNEYFVLGIKSPVNGALGQIIYDTVHIINYQYPQVPIASLTGDDAQGAPDSIARNFVIEGIVHGVNYSATGGLDFYVLQNGAGINVYQPAGQTYTPTAGDKVKVWGTVGQFRGLTRMEMPDSIQLVSNNNILETPKPVTVVTENEESAYISIDSLKLYPGISTWPNNAVVYAVQANTLDTIEMYVSANTNLAGTAAPIGYFNLVGIGSQFNNSTNAPYNNGYRVMAVNKDMVAPASVKNASQNFIGLTIFPNPAVNQLTIQANGYIGDIAIYNISGQCVWTERSVQSTITIPITGWKPGSYLLQQSNGSEKKIYHIIKL